jgi:peptidoglycan hydrolase-like protein with peptidoglycan-binding domain
VTLRFSLLAVGIGFAVAGSLSADENVREVQEKLRDGGFYSGEIDGAYSSQLAAALTRYQIRNELPITGQLDGETSNALGAKPAVTTDADPERSSEAWRGLRRRERQTIAKTTARETSSPGAEETPASGTQMRPRSAPAAIAAIASANAEPAQRSSVATPVTSEPRMPGSPSLPAPVSSESAKPASALPATAPAGDVSTERLRDYVGAFVLAGLDPHVGSEADFFADRVRYYDQGVIGREQIRNDLQDYAGRWPERRFWFVGNITIEPQRGNRVRVTFPLQYELRNGATHSSGKINKTLVLEPVGDDLQIVAVSEREAE